MLKVENLNVHYGSTQILWNVSLQVSAGEIAAIMGPNGSGKSTILKAIIGLVKASSGAVTLDGETLLGVPTHEMLARRVGLIMERRCLFPAMSVMENVRMGAFHPVAAAQFDENLAWVRQLFPLIDEKANAAAGQLSGGQQQMVAIARGLMGAPRYLMMDEPFLGLSPRIVDQIADVMNAVKARGIAVIFNEQNAHLSFSLSDRGYLLESGRIVIEGSGLGMLENDKIRQVYLGMETAGQTGDGHVV